MHPRFIFLSPTLFVVSVSFAFRSRSVVFSSTDFRQVITFNSPLLFLKKMYLTILLFSPALLLCLDPRHLSILFSFASHLSCPPFSSCPTLSSPFSLPLLLSSSPSRLLESYFVLGNPVSLAHLHDYAEHH